MKQHEKRVETSKRRDPPSVSVFMSLFTRPGRIAIDEESVRISLFVTSCLLLARCISFRTSRLHLSVRWIRNHSDPTVRDDATGSWKPTSPFVSTVAMGNVPSHRFANEHPLSIRKANGLGLMLSNRWISRPLPRIVSLSQHLATLRGRRIRWKMSIHLPSIHTHTQINNMKIK